MAGYITSATYCDVMYAIMTVGMRWHGFDTDRLINYPISNRSDE
jgi:hypothetical protein